MGSSYDGSSGLVHVCDHTIRDNEQNKVLLSQRETQKGNEHGVKYEQVIAYNEEIMNFKTVQMKLLIYLKEKKNFQF